MPVLVRQVVEQLRVPPGGVVLDATVGLGGHAAALLEILGPAGRYIGLDVDEGNLAVARRRLAASSERILLLRRNFGEIRSVLDELGIPGVNAILADLGVSTNQLTDPQRGFSFAADGPLDMRLDDRQRTTACDIVNAYSERDLSDLIWNYSQERFSRRIAKRICEARRDARIRRTGELARIVSSAVGVDPASRKSKIHPATRVFLALRIAVNDEVHRLESLLEQVPTCLLAATDDDGGSGGRVGIISFQSIEDGLVKRDFRRREAAGQYTICTKKPITPEADEIQRNPRARSAKLRVAQRVG